MVLLESEKLIIERLDKIEKVLKRLLEAKLFESIEELSLNKTCKLLHRSNEYVYKLVNDQQLKAMTYKDNKGKIRYRFRLSDIHEYQKNMIQLTERNVDETETAEEIARRIFKQQLKDMPNKRK